MEVNWRHKYCPGWESIVIHVGCVIQGKDRIIFVTKEDHETPSNAELIAEDPDDPYEEQG